MSHSFSTFAVKRVENLRNWRNGKRKSTFAIPIVLSEGKDHITDCYFYVINLKGIGRKNKSHVQYPNVPSAIRPISHGSDLSVPEPDGNMEYSSDSEHSDMTVVAGDERIQARRERPVSTLDISRTQWLDTKPETFKEDFITAKFMS